MNKPPQKSPRPMLMLVPKRTPKKVNLRQQAELAMEVGRLACQIRERTEQIRQSLKSARQL